MSDQAKEELESIVLAANLELGATHKSREKALALSRSVVRNSANSIRATHRKDFQEAHRLLAEVTEMADKFVPIYSSHPSIYFGGYVEDSLKEFAEASIVLSIAEGTQLKGPDELGIGPAPYLNGLAEVIGELRRLILDSLRRDDFERCEEFLEVMDVIYTVLVSIDFPDAVTRGLRRSTDVSRSILERTRGDLTQALRQNRLESKMAELEYSFKSGPHDTEAQEKSQA